MLIAQTPRLTLREARAQDAPFFLELMNEDAWSLYIGVHEVTNLEAALLYLEQRVWSMYRTWGYGLWVVQATSVGAPVGICGLLRRDRLNAPELGVAVLERHQRQGYALEACRAVLEHGERVLGLRTIHAVAMASNARSIHLLRQLGFQPCSAPRSLADSHLSLHLLELGAGPRAS